jgi:hypothetical protein
MGVATEVELRDYFRQKPSGFRPAVRELIDAGELVPVEIDGRKGPYFLHHAAKIPRRAAPTTLLSPFDPLIWHRGRTERLFDFFYRIEIYVPAAKRVHGYYVLPFLLDGKLVGRVDLKADRKAGTLLVPGAFADYAAPKHTAVALAAELRRLADWLGLEKVEAPIKGDLATELGRALRSREI